jgi:hypothetical protein
MVSIVTAYGLVEGYNISVFQCKFPPPLKKNQTYKKIFSCYFDVTTLLTISGAIYMMYLFFCNPILFAIFASTFSKLVYKRIQWHVEECLVALLCN